MCLLTLNQLDKKFLVIVGAAFILFQTSERLIGFELWPDFFFVFLLVLVLNSEPRLQKITRLQNTTHFLSVMKQHFLFFTAMPAVFYVSFTLKSCISVWVSFEWLNYSRAQESGKCACLESIYLFLYSANLQIPDALCWKAVNTGSLAVDFTISLFPLPYPLFGTFSEQMTSLSWRLKLSRLPEKNTFPLLHF